MKRIWVLMCWIPKENFPPLCWSKKRNFLCCVREKRRFSFDKVPKEKKIEEKTKFWEAFMYYRKRRMLVDKFHIHGKRVLPLKLCVLKARGYFGMT
jgi:hypothetical protein